MCFIQKAKIIEIPSQSSIRQIIIPLFINFEWEVNEIRHSTNRIKNFYNSFIPIVLTRSL